MLIGLNFKGTYYMALQSVLEKCYKDCRIVRDHDPFHSILRVKNTWIYLLKDLRRLINLGTSDKRQNQ